MRLPRTIAGYRFVELLGVGALGAVYRAVIYGGLGFEQEVAIKVLNSVHASEEPDQVAALANEARILSQVQHPNIVQARHFRKISDDALGDTWVLVLELVRGQSLRRLLAWDRDAPSPLPIEAPLHFMSEAADGLHFAHRLTDEAGRHVGLVHRDLKPANIHVTNEGRVKILDFGIAWAKRRLGANTGSGLTKGTPLHMSPEQLRADKLDGRSDLYALGTIGYQFLTGEPYVRLHGGWPDQSPLNAALQTQFKHREGVLRAALERRYDLDPTGAPANELIALIGDLLAHDPDDRPREGGEVFDRLEDLPALHRPSRGRGALRRWTEWRNKQDADARWRGEVPEDLRQEKQAPRQISATVVLGDRS